jgi:hypothetical protein
VSSAASVTVTPTPSPSVWVSSAPAFDTIKFKRGGTIATGVHSGGPWNSRIEEFWRQCLFPRYHDKFEGWVVDVPPAPARSRPVSLPKGVKRLRVRTPAGHRSTLDFEGFKCPHDLVNTLTHLYPDPSTTLPALLLATRKARGLSRRRASQEVEGISQSYWTKIEAGESTPGLDLKNRLEAWIAS